MKLHFIVSQKNFRKLSEIEKSVIFYFKSSMQYNPKGTPLDESP